MRFGLVSGEATATARTSAVTTNAVLQKVKLTRGADPKPRLTKYATNPEGAKVSYIVHNRLLELLTLQGITASYYGAVQLRFPVVLNQPAWTYFHLTG